MSDLERYGHAIGESRCDEPKAVSVSCRIHEKFQGRVLIYADEYVPLCCLFGTIDIPFKLGGVGFQFAAIPLKAQGAHT